MRYYKWICQMIGFSFMGGGSSALKELDFSHLSEHYRQDFIVLAHRLLHSQVRFGFAWFYKKILAYKKIVSQVLLATFFIQLFTLITPLFTQVILDKVLTHHSISTLNVIAVAFLALIIFEITLSLARNYIFAHTTCKIDARLGSELFARLLSLPMTYFENRKVGNIVARIKELDNIRDFIANKSITLILDLLFSVVFVVMMFVYSAKLALIAVSFSILIATLYLIITPILRNRLKEKFTQSAAQNSYLVESITGIGTIKSLSIESSMKKSWDNYLGNYILSSFRLTNLGNFSSNLAMLFQKLMTLCILYVGVGQVIATNLTIGQLIAFQMFASQFLAPIMRLTQLYNEFQQAILSVDRIGDILNSPSEQVSSKAIALNAIKGDIRFEHISFRYTPNTNLVIDDFNLISGKSVGIVGRSGSGKSTIAKLLQRLYLQDGGAIYIDGLDLRHLNPNILRQNIGVVLQESYLFSGTIKDNISYAKKSASMQEIIDVATIAGAHDFITTLPKGYDTFVGERGSSLSGGQKQRIAIARALITNPKILIFDEATSALDYESESIITTNLAKIKANKTFIIIAHRLSTVKNCDEIIVLDRGKITEQGTHGELIKKDGYYRFLWINQGLLNENA